MSKTRGLRSAFRTLHRWLGIGALVLLMPVALSGALLVYHDELDVLMNPSRHATTGTEVVAPSRYFANAEAAPGVGVVPSNIRLPHEAGEPVIALARISTGEGARPRFLRIYLDPPTAKVLDVFDFRASAIGFLHVFHENLMIPEYSGRAIVGWVGVAMLILSLSGIYLWWPRNRAFIQGLRWRRAPATSSNLHHIIGFWISLPLALVSLTGIYLAFLPQARELTAKFAPMTPSAGRAGFGPVLRQTAMTADQALQAAQAREPSAQPRQIFAPAAGRDSQPVWRIVLHRADGEAITILVNDRNGELSQLPLPLAGDRLAQWMRWLHEGSHTGVIWRFVVFLTGIFPIVLGVTGVMMWLRDRRRRRLAVGGTQNAGKLQAAE
jgi:uncharacterized iron-regulated membrane protein